MRTALSSRDRCIWFLHRWAFPARRSHRNSHSNHHVLWLSQNGVLDVWSTPWGDSFAISPPWGGVVGSWEQSRGGKGTLGIATCGGRSAHARNTSDRCWHGPLARLSRLRRFPWFDFGACLGCQLKFNIVKHEAPCSSKAPLDSSTAGWAAYSAEVGPRPQVGKQRFRLSSS